MDHRNPSLRDLFHLLFRYKAVIASALLVSVGAAGGYAVLVFPSYRAEVRLLVRLGKESLSAITAYQRETYNILVQHRAQQINNEIEIFRGGEFTGALFQRFREKLEELDATRERTGIRRVRELASETVRRVREVAAAPLYALGLARRLSAEERLVRALKEAAHIEALEDTDIIKVTFTWHDPDFAAFALNELVAAYLRLHLKVHEAGSSHVFYVDQIGVYEKRLRDLERQLKEFTTTRGISNVRLQKELLLRDMSDLERKQTDVVAAYEDARAKIEKVGEMYRRPGAWVETPKMKGQDFSELKSLDDAYFKLQEERSGFRGGSREAERIEGQIARVRTQKAESLLNILDAEVRAKGKERAVLDRELAEKRAQFNGLNRMTLAVDELEREREIVQNNYILYKKKAEELRISDELDEKRITSVRLVSPAAAPDAPVAPRRRLILALAAVLGLVGGLACALVADAFDHSFRDERDVGRVLDIPVLLSVPRLRVR